MLKNKKISLNPNAPDNLYSGALKINEAFDEIGGKFDAAAEVSVELTGRMENVTLQLTDTVNHSKGSVNIEQYSHLIPNKVMIPDETNWNWTLPLLQAIKDTDGTVIFADRKYNINDIEITKVVNLKGSSKRNTILNVLPGAVHGVYYNGTAKSINNPIIANLQITGAKGLKFYHVHRWSLTNVEIMEVSGDGFIADYSWVGTILSSYIHHNNGKGINLMNDANAVEIFASEIQGNRQYGVFIGDNVLGTHISGATTIEGNGLSGVYAKFAKVLTIEGCYFEKNGFQPGVNPPHALAHIYIDGSPTNKAYGVNIKGNIFNEIRNDPDGTKDGYSVYLNSVINPVLEGNAYLYNGLGAIYTSDLTEGALSINDFTTDESIFSVGNKNRLTAIKAGKSLNELSVNGGLRGTKTSGMFINSDAPTGWAFVLQSKNSANVDTPRLVINAGTDVVDISTINNNISMGTGLLKKKSPDGSIWRIGVSNDGTISTVKEG